LEDIALLQRGTGECLITVATRPDISKEILANNGVVLTFKNHIEKEIMCELLNLSNEKKSYLSFLEEGQCIIRVNSIKEPFLLLVPYHKRKSLTVSEIMKRNKKVLENLKIIKDYDLELKEEQVHKQSLLIKFKSILNVLRNFLINVFLIVFKPDNKKSLNEGKSEIENRDFERKSMQVKGSNPNLRESNLKQFKDLVNDLYKLQEKKY